MRFSQDIRLRFPSVLTAFLLLCISTAEAAAAEILTLNGNDRSISVTDTRNSQTDLNAVTLPGFPSQAVVAKQNLYVVVSGADQVLVLNKETLELSQVIATGPGTNPYAAAVDVRGNVYVSLLLTGEVVRFDSRGRETGRAPVGRSPEGLCILGPRLYVANSGFRFSDFGYDPGTVSVLDLAGLATVATVPVGTNPQWLAVSGREIHVVCTGNYFSEFGEIRIFDARTLVPAGTISLGGSPGFLALGEDTGYTSDYFGGISSYRISTREVLHDASHPIAFGGTGYSGLALDGKGRLFVAMYEDDVVARLRVSDGSLAAVYPAGDGPVHLALRHVSQGVEPNRKTDPIADARPGDTAGSPVAFRVMSQPARGAALLSFENGAPGDVQLDLFDVRGRKVADWSGPVGGTLRWDLSRIAAGVYTVRAVQGNTRTTRRLVIVP